MLNRFEDFIVQLQQRGFAGNDQIVQIVLPLFEEVASFHEAGKVAPLNNFETLLVTNNCLDIDEAFVQFPSVNMTALAALKQRTLSALNITGEHTRNADIDTGFIDYNDESFASSTKEIDADSITKPVFLPNYKSYEIQLQHHDALTDIYLLGLVLASVATLLNFYDEEDCKTFITDRSSLTFINANLHPSIANIIAEMTALNRSQRSRDLQEVIFKLKNFREYNSDQNIDLTNLASYKKAVGSERRRLVFNKLRSRLFDTSRRNRLLYFKSNMRFLNLTVSSFPMSLNLHYVKPEHLFYWNEQLAERVTKGQSLHLNKYLKTDENEYVIPSLDKIRLEMQKDQQEYGMSQLRLSVAFLHWYNLKEESHEKISSPLILIPVSLSKKKSLRKDDDFILGITSTEAEVNPILRFMLAETYGIKLPERIDLSELDLVAFFNQLKQGIDAAKQGIKITLIDKPRIKIIHSIAQRTASVYARRSRQRAKGVAHYNMLDYSYDRQNFQPLGLQIFRNFVMPKSTILESITSSKTVKSFFFTPPVAEEKKTRFAMDDGDANPYMWEFDLCHIVLGNFNYRKMSLVRDYNEVLASGEGEHIFETLFSEDAKPFTQTDTTKTFLHEQYPVIQADPTQLAAVLKARQGKSYIIQGPPGTGKSQTITNLIADYLAHGKKVLFVCEKKAAIDVVYHRLQSKGLHHMCSVVHDTQDDKKQMIADLKTTYEEYLKPGADIIKIETERNILVAKLNAQLHLLESLHNLSSVIHHEAGEPVYKLLNRLLNLQEKNVALTPISNAVIPDYKAWIESGQTVINIQQNLHNAGKIGGLANHPARNFNAAGAQQQHLSTLQVEQQLNALAVLLENLQKLAAPQTTIAELIALVNEATQLKDYALNNNLFVLDKKDPRAKELDALIASFTMLQKEHEQALQNNKAWINKLPQQELENALPQIKKYESSFFKFLSGNWRSVSKAIKSNYDFAQHQVKPTLKQVVENLLKEYKLQENKDKTQQQIQEEYSLEDVKKDWENIQTFRRNQTAAGAKKLQEWKENPELVLRLHNEAEHVEKAADLLQQTWLHYNNAGLQPLQQQVAAMAKEVTRLPELLHYLEQLSKADIDLQNIVRNEAVDATSLELTMIEHTLQKLYRQYSNAEKLNAGLIEEIANDIQVQYDQLLQVNAEYIKAVNRKYFTDNMQLAQQANSTLTNEQKEQKKVYTEGRKVLENEFTKSRRYKSIRELADGSTGVVLRDIKPVWLMSPLSVSDALPLGANNFDVVIFDEASQITLEEGVPTMFRAPQSIIVGDEMQMPPTNFFSTGTGDPDDLTDTGNEEEDSILLDADSLLTQGARKLHSIMLGWHYRSRYESLISFSNASFYKGELLTIPDRKMFDRQQEAIVVNKPEDAEANVDKALSRSISYHYLPKGIYEARSNTYEAAYIAQLIKKLLTQNSKQTVGIVAFSMEQQGVIEDALELLQQQDKDFDARVEEEYQRTDDGQFTGLIIKNLENVQGDERDIIIISTCYGYSRDGKMLMNFGPINRKGGEKRLNVIFSRAKQHVIVVSSIQFTDIKNEHNEGANFFRKYLQYAALVSSGNMQQANLVLHGINHKLAQLNTQTNKLLTVTQQVKRFLESEGFEVQENVGQSVFKCSLGVKRNGDDAFRLGILIDDELHYNNKDILEQYVQRPAIMKNFSWKVERMLTKDWVYNAEEVKKTLLGALK